VTGRLASGPSTQQRVCVMRVLLTRQPCEPVSVLGHHWLTRGPRVGARGCEGIGPRRWFLLVGQNEVESA
jgi:hypothetical protein